MSLIAAVEQAKREARKAALEEAAKVVMRFQYMHSQTAETVARVIRTLLPPGEKE